MNQAIREELAKKIQYHFRDASPKQIEYAGGGYDYNHEDMIDDFLAPLNIEWSEHGVSKIVIKFEDIDGYVVKIPFMGKHYYPDEYDDDYYDCDCDEGDCVDFGSADLDCPFYNDNPSDYCETESHFYEMAVDNHLEDMFAGTYFICTVDGYPVYVSEEVDRTIEDLIYGSDYKVDDASYKKAQAITGYENYSFNIVLAMYIEGYGEAKAREFRNFIDGWGITDRHYGNFGVDKFGKIKFIDYSSWND